MTLAGDAWSVVRNSPRALATRLRVDSIVSEAASAVSRFIARRTWMTPEDRRWRTAQTGIYHRVVWSVPGDALAEGWSTSSGDDGQDMTADLDKTLGVEVALLKARAAARQDGGAWLWPVTNDQDWSQPLSEGPHEITALHVLAESEVTPVDFERDARKPSWARPSLVSVSVQRDGLSQNIARMHASRLVYVSGAPATPTQTTAKRGYDLPVLELYRAALDDYEAGTAKVGRLLARLSMPWVNVKGGVAQTAASGGGVGVQDDLQSRLELLKEGMLGPLGMLLLLGEDTAGWSGPTLAGVRDAINVLAERISAVEGWPLSDLLGQAPGGLSTDDESGKRTKHALLERERKLLGATLLDLYLLILGPDPEREIVWPSLTKPSVKEEAEISLLRAQRGQVLVDSGAITGDEERARFEKPGQELPLPVLPEEEDEEDVTPIDGETETPIDPNRVIDPKTGAPTATQEDVQKTALNGAQVASAKEIVEAVAGRKLPRDTGIQMLVSFFNLTEPDATKLMGEVGLTFFATEPAKEPVDESMPSKDAPGADPSKAPPKPGSTDGGGAPKG